MILFLTTVFLVLATSLVSRRMGVDGLLSPVMIVSFSTLFYAVVVPLELWYRDEQKIGWTPFTMSPLVAERAVLAAVMFLVIFYCGYAALATRSRSVELESSAPGFKRARAIALLASLLGITLLATVFRANVIAANDYLSNVAQTAIGGSGAGYFVINRWTYLSYGIFAFLSIAQARRPLLAVLWLLPLAGWSIVSNDKDPLLVAVLACGGYLYVQLERRPRVPRALVPTILIGGVLALGFGAAAFGTQRAGQEVTSDSLSSFVDDGLYINIDPAGPSGVVAQTMLSNPGGESYTTTFRALVAWLPAVIRPFEARDDVAVSFAKQYWKNWQPGFGYGYSPLAEGWRVDGYLGIAVYALLLGVAFAGLRNGALGANSRYPTDRAVRVASYYVVAGYLAFTLMRSSIGSFVSTAAICVALVVVLLLASRVFGVRRPAEEEVKQR